MDECNEISHERFFELQHDRLVLRGEIDSMAAQAWPWAADRTPEVTVIDARGVTFLDAQGLGLLLRVARAADPATIQLCVIGRTVPRLLHLTHLDFFFDVHVH